MCTKEATRLLGHIVKAKLGYGDSSLLMLELFFKNNVTALEGVFGRGQSEDKSHVFSSIPFSISKRHNHIMRWYRTKIKAIFPSVHFQRTHTVTDIK